MSAQTIQIQLLQFLSRTTGRGDLTGESELLEAGLADSLTMMDFLVFIESEYHVRLDFNDLRPEVFRSAGTLSELIASRLPEQKSRAA